MPLSARTRALSLVVSAALLAGCSFAATPTAAHSPAPASPALTSPPPTSKPSAGASPTAAPSSAPTPTPADAPSTAASCTGPIPAGDNLILGAIAGSAAVVLRDITDLANPRTLCTFAGTPSPRFVTASVISFSEGGANLGDPGDVLRVDLGAASQRKVATWSGSTFGSGLFDWSPDGQSATYVAPAGDGWAWHLLTAGAADRVLTTMPPVPGRGGSPDDSFSVSFSPDGLYLAMVETFTTGSGETAPVQVRRASDGGLVHSAASGTMGVWASVPSRFFYRENHSGAVSRWDPSTGVSPMQSSLQWVRPFASPDGRWVAYTVYDGQGLPHVGLYSVQGNSFGLINQQLRSGAQFVNDRYVWYQGESLCGGNPCGLRSTQPSGTTYLYEIATSTENTSRIKSLYDAWPRGTGHGT